MMTTLWCAAQLHTFRLMQTLTCTSMHAAYIDAAWRCCACAAVCAAFVINLNSRRQEYEPATTAAVFLVDGDEDAEKAAMLVRGSVMPPPEAVSRPTESNAIFAVRLDNDDRLH